MAEGAIIRFGTVTNVDDVHDGGRIQVRTVYDNPTENDEELYYCIPFLPKMFFVIPKVGELVLVISMAAGDHDNCNFYVGPLISQEDKLFYEGADGAMRITEQGYIGWGPNPRNKKGTKPTLFPVMDDIAIEGRKDTGIQLKDEEVRIKAGVKIVDNFNNPKNNLQSPSFISLKYYPKNTYDNEGYKSTATIVADKINLIGTNANNQQADDSFIANSQNENGNSEDNLIPDSTMKELINKAHRVPFGDTLIEFLDILRTAFAKHVHPFPTMAPCNDENVKTVSNYDLESILSDNVRIN